MPNPDEPEQPVLSIPEPSPQPPIFREPQKFPIVVIAPEDLASFLENGRIRRRQIMDWTVEKVVELAKNYPSKSQFREAHHGAFKWLKKKGKLDLLPWKIQKYRLWNEESAIEAATQCYSMKDFAKRFSGAYEFLRRYGLDHKLKGLFLTSQVMWNERTALAEARLFIKTHKPCNITKFKLARAGAYCFLQKSGKLHLLKSLF